jgi:hypothetical protein
LVPADEEFRDDFTRYEESTPAVARWILRELEIEALRQASPDKGAQMAPIVDPDSVNLEHILPKNPGESWRAPGDKDPSFQEECRLRLGNMCLLDRPSNRSKGSKRFSDKRKVYLQSAFVLTRQVAEDYMVWDRAGVDHRQSKLAELALAVWKA